MTLTHIPVPSRVHIPASGAQSELTLNVCIRSTLALSWDSQVVQYPPRGPRGIEYRREFGALCPPSCPGPPHCDEYVECLLYRDKSGKVRGILNFYPMDSIDGDGRVLERAGNVNLWVEPRFQGKGIAMKLLAECERRFGPINFAQQRYTVAGAVLVRHYLEKHPR